MDKNKINITEIRKDLGKIHLKIDKKFLKFLLLKSSKSSRPHLDRHLQKKLKMKSNNKYKVNTTIYGWTRYANSVPLDKFLIILKLSNTSAKFAQSKIISLKAGMRGKEIFPKFPIIIGNSLGLIMGHILGDGSIDRKYKQVFYSNSNKELLKEFEKHMFEVFSIKPRIWQQDASNFEGKTKWDKRLDKIDDLEKGRNCGLFYPSICGILLNSILYSFAIGKKKKIPEGVFNQSKKFKIGLIKSFFDDEGSVGNRNIRLHQDNKEILVRFKILLIDVGISPGNIKTYIKKGKERHYLDIHKKSNFIKYWEKIGFTSSKKEKKLENLVIIKNYKNSK